jgi:uncharacterized protein HemY
MEKITLVRNRSKASAVLGDLYLKENNFFMAKTYLLKAWELTRSNAEKDLIMKKINTIPG